MKKILLLIVSMLFLFSACTPSKEEKTITVVMPDGAPSLVFAKLMYENKKIDGYGFNFEVVAGVQGVQAKINDLDFAVMPTNLAANLYNKGEKIQLVSVNIHGVLYIVGKEETELEGLKGKVVYNIGRGGTPDFTLQYILDNAEIPYEVTDGEVKEGKVALKYETDGSVVLAGLLSGSIEYAVIGEPMVTQAVEKSNGMLKAVISLQDEWNKATAQSGYSYPQAGIVVKSEFAEKNPQTVAALLTELDGVSDWLEDNTDKALSALNANGSTIKVITAASVNRSNVYTVKAENARNTLISYFDILKGKQPALIGGKLPDNGFYYGYTSD